MDYDSGMLWFTSDNHWGHARVIEFCDRPFSSVEEMNEVMAERWNERIKPDDTVIHMGDVAMGRRDENLQIVKRLNGKKFLVSGNHDYCWSGHKKIRPQDRLLYTGVGFQILPREMLYAVAGQIVLLCHLPYVGDHFKEERYSEFRPQDEGRWLLCGHVHEAWKVLGHQVNVGVDQWNFYPVSEEEIGAIINA